jgi:CTP synthase
MQLECGESDTLFIHVTLAPILDVVGEQKTKPTQHSVQELRRIGIQPYVLTVRCKNPLNQEAKHKISLFASVKEECVISCHDAPSIYHVPEILERQGIVNVISRKLELRNSKVKWNNWKNVTSAYVNPKGAVNIGIVGKYVDLPDSYVSVFQALLHASAKLYRRLEVAWIEPEIFEKSDIKTRMLKNFNGILVPGGFGIRGSKGIIQATNFARKQDIPFLGICFGFQLALLEFARNQCDLREATSEEFDGVGNTSVVKFMPEQKNISNLGGSMRLGKHTIRIIPHTLASKIYGKNTIERRHRHRYEFNQEYRKLLEENGMVLSGHSDYGRRIEILEIPKHKFFLGVQFHSEFNSRPGKPEESFFAFVRACANA